MYTSKREEATALAIAIVRNRSNIAATIDIVDVKHIDNIYEVILQDASNTEYVVQLNEDMSFRDYTMHQDNKTLALTTITAALYAKTRRDSIASVIKSNNEDIDYSNRLVITNIELLTEYDIAVFQKNKENMLRLVIGVDADIVRRNNKDDTITYILLLHNEPEDVSIPLKDDGTGWSFMYALGPEEYDDNDELTGRSLTFNTVYKTLKDAKILDEIRIRK